MKRNKNQEILNMLMIMAKLAQKMLKRIKREDLQSSEKAEQLLDNLRSEYLDNRAAE